MITRDLITTIADQYRGRLDGVHGLGHWARVLENGRRVAGAMGETVDLRVVELFAVFHDACRVTDAIDHGHGARGADLADQLRGRRFDLDDDAMALLLDACRRHTDGELEAPATVRVCWDADRLDLLRCKIQPQPERLATEAARDPELLAWACRRAERLTVPEVVTTHWQPWLDSRPGS